MPLKSIRKCLLFFVNWLIGYQKLYEYVYKNFLAVIHVLLGGIILYQSKIAI